MTWRNAWDTAKATTETMKDRVVDFAVIAIKILGVVALCGGTAAAILFLCASVAVAVQERRDEATRSMMKQYPNSIECDRSASGKPVVVTAKLLMYRECDMRYGVGNYEVECVVHDGFLLYRVVPKKPGARNQDREIHDK